MISCFKGGATNVWRKDYENTHAAFYTSTSDLTQGEGLKISKIIESLKQYDNFKYSAYRTAFKLRVIQKASKLHMMDLSIISGILKDYGCDDCSVDEVISPEKAENLICSLYTEAGKKVGFTEEPRTMAQVFLAFLHNTFVEDDKPLLLVHVKIALALFSAAKLPEKHKYIFYHCCCGETMNVQNLHLLLKSLSKLAEVVGEQVTFGSHLVSNAARHCLKFCKGKISEKKFRKWLSLEPQTLVWISTLHRITASETTQHFISCNYCKAGPIIGLRYRCLQCINYNLCQDCFLRGLSNSRHKERHIVQEFCQPASTWEETKATFSAIKNKLPFARCPAKPYLSFDEESLCESTRVSSRNPSKISTTMNCSIKKTTSVYLIKELSSIINQLENEKKEITTVIEKLNAADTEGGTHQITDSIPSKDFVNKQPLHDLNSNLELQLQRLKDLLKNLKVPSTLNKEPDVVSPVPHAPFNKLDHYFESTPVNSIINPIQSNAACPQFSSLCVNSTESIPEKQRYHNSSLEFSNVLTNCASYSSSEKKYFASSVSNTNSLEDQPPSMSLELTKLLSSSSPASLSARLAELNCDMSKVSPLFLNSTAELNDTPERKHGYNYSVTPLRKSAFLFSSSKENHSTFSVNKDGSLEIMELELQAMLQHLEQLLPRVPTLSNDSRVEKEKVISALSEMEEAVKKLSHLSIELSTGSSHL